MGDADKGGVSLFRKEIPLPCTLPEKIHIAGEQLEELRRLPIATCCARQSRVSIAIRFASAPTTRCCAAVGSSAALRMRHTPCGCRSAYLVEVRSNLRLLRHYSMRRAQQCRYFASSLPPSKRHSRLTTVRRGCCQVATRRDSWRSHVHRTYTAQRVQSFKLQTRNVGGQGAEPLAFSWGSKGAILSRERMAPLSVQRHRRCLSLPRRARETPSPVGQIKKVQLFLKNPLDKWAPRAIMQPTSEELQTYDGEK